MGGGSDQGNDGGQGGADWATAATALWMMWLSYRFYFMPAAEGVGAAAGTRPVGAIGGRRGTDWAASTWKTLVEACYGSMVAIGEGNEARWHGAEWT